MNPRCFIGGEEAQFLLEKDGYMHYKCYKCGLVFVWPLPNDEKLKTEVYSEESGYQAGKTTDDGSLSHSKHTERILSVLDIGKLLDVGCSSGDFLITTRARGFDVIGVELNPRTAKQAQSRGLDVKIGALVDSRFDDEQFDIVHLGDVIEHVPDPRALINECVRVLKSKGTLIVSTPNTGCFWSKTTFMLYKWFKIPWSTATPPHHLFLFNSHCLDELMVQVGFSKINKWYERPPRLMYELGNTHLWGKYKREKSLRNIAFLIFAFALYLFTYAMNFILHPLLTRDFGQVGVYQKNA